MQTGTVLHHFILLLLFAIVGSGCEWGNSSPSAPTSPATTPTMDQRLVGTWYTGSRFSTSATDGYQVESNGTVHRLVVDNLKRLQYDPQIGPGQFRISKVPGIFSFTFPDTGQSASATVSEFFSIEPQETDTALALNWLPGGPNSALAVEVDFVRKNVGDVVQ
jgi:hypothetical protein